MTPSVAGPIGSTRIWRQPSARSARPWATEDRSKFIIRKAGGSLPPEYYVLQDGRMALLGRANPELREAKLGPVSLIQYAARDGLIPAILTKPDPAVFGPVPYPAIITPHGGPWARLGQPCFF